MKTNTKVPSNVKQAAEVFEKHANTIRAAIWFHINDKSSIDDVFQDFFLSLVERPIPRLNQNIRAFINRAIRNDILDAVSKNKSYHMRNNKYAQMHKERLKTQTPDDIVSHNEEIRRLFDIIENQLLRHESEAVIQKYRYNRDAVKTAHIMGINKRSVSHYLCTGLRKLRRVVCEQQSI